MSVACSACSSTFCLARFSWTTRSSVSVERTCSTTSRPSSDASISASRRTPASTSQNSSCSLKGVSRRFGGLHEDDCPARLQAGCRKRVERDATVERFPAAADGAKLERLTVAVERRSDRLPQLVGGKPDIETDQVLADHLR